METLTHQGAEIASAMPMHDTTGLILVLAPAVLTALLFAGFAIKYLAR